MACAKLHKEILRWIFSAHCAVCHCFGFEIIVNGQQRLTEYFVSSRKKGLVGWGGVGGIKWCGRPRRQR